VNWDKAWRGRTGFEGLRTRCGLDDFFHVDSNIKSGTQRVVNHAEQIDLVDDDRSFKFSNDPDDRPKVGTNVGVLYLATSIGVPVGE
jgi:hypothetical protein